MEVAGGASDAGRRKEYARGSTLPTKYLRKLAAHPLNILRDVSRELDSFAKSILQKRTCLTYVGQVPRAGEPEHLDVPGEPGELGGAARRSGGAHQRNIHAI